MFPVVVYVSPAVSAYCVLKGVPCDVYVRCDS